MKPFNLFLLCLALGAASCDASKSNSTDPASRPADPPSKYTLLDSLDKRVTLEHIPAINVISIPFSGNYGNHPEAYSQLIAYANKNYATTGGTIGMYPQDPDLVPEAYLTWEISLRIIPGKPGRVNFPLANANDPFAIRIPEDLQAAPLSSFATPGKPYVLKQLPPTDAITLVSDIARIGQDGLAINAWIDLNNYVQTATTRTEFGSPDQPSQLIPVKIIIPIKKRLKETIH